MAKAPKPLLRVSGGNPAGFEDFVPLNPWGRAMPKPPNRERPELYQVVARDTERGNAETRLGPQWAKPFAEMLQLTIAEQISLGNERRYSDPVVIKIVPDLGRPALMGA